jgi:SNF2 family DNA or RNA helicase
MIKLSYKDNELIWTGDTYPIHNAIKALGFLWDPLLKQWHSRDISADKLEQIKQSFPTDKLIIDNSIKGIKLEPSEQFKFLKQKFPALFDFQIDGILFGQNKDILNADHMGLGKTIQGIVLANFYNLPVLMVAPKSVLKQWQYEIKKWINENSIIIKGVGTKQNYFSEKWTLVGYEKLLRDNMTKIDKHKEMKLSPDIKYPYSFVLIADEASKLRSYKTDIYKFFRILCYRATKKIFLTGTPIEKNLTDFYNICKLLNPKFMDLMEFRGNYCIFKKIRIKNPRYNPNNPNSERYTYVEPIAGYKNLDVFVQKIAPFCIRRKREDVFDQLPELQKENRIVDLTPIQIKVYNKIIDKAREAGKSKFEILQLLRLVADDCRLFKDSSSEFIDDLDIRNIDEKGEKIEELKNILDESEGKILIFTQFERMAEFIHQEIEDSLLIVGGMTDNKRNAIIDCFKTEKRVLVSTDTLAYGMNLQYVPTLINFDLPWNPSTLEQRISRIHGRIGGLSKNLVINLITERIEDRVLEVLEQKQNLFDDVVEGKAIKDEDLRKMIISKFLD